MQNSQKCVQAGDSRNSLKSCVRAEDSETTCVRELKSQRIRKIHVIRSSVTTKSCNQLLRIQLTMAEFLSRQERSQPPTPCEPSEFEKMKHELTHIRFKPWCTSCVKGKAQAEPHQRIERIVKNSELPLVQCDYLVLKDIAASLKVWSMYVKSFGYGTSTVVEMKGATDTFAVTWRVKMLNCLGLSDIFLQCDPEPSLIKCAESVERTVIRTSPRRSHQSNGAVANYQKICRRDKCTQCWQHFKTARNTGRPLTKH